MDAELFGLPVVYIVNAVLGVLVIVGAWKYFTVVKAAVKVALEGADVIRVYTDALADGKITPEEMVAGKKEIADISISVNALKKEIELLKKKKTV